MNDKTKVFESKEEKGLKKFQLASGCVSLTEILFADEGIVAKIEAKGMVEFLDCNNVLLGAVELPAQVGGREVYEAVVCGVEAEKICLKFPIVEWIDHYPHCDGEYDRWDSKVVGYHTVLFDVKTKRAVLESEDIA